MKSFLTTLIALSVISAPALAKGKAKAKAESAVVDTEASSLAWEGSKITGKHNGKVKLSKGTLELNHDHQVTGGEFTVNLDSMSNDDLTDAGYNKKLVDHLKADDFFDVAKYPTAVYKIRSVKAKASDKGTHEVSGDLTMKGITKPLNFPATITVDGDTVKAVGTAVIDRTLWNLRYGSGKFFKGLGDKTIHDNFTVAINLTAKK